MAHKPHALVLDDDEYILKEIPSYLEESFDVESVSTLDEARSILSAEEEVEKFSVIIADMKLPEDEEGGLTLARELSSRRRHPEIVILTAYADIANASKCMQAGAFGYVEKGREDSYTRLEKTCIEASERWYRQRQRIAPSLTEHPVALLCGDVALRVSHLLSEAEEREVLHIASELHIVAPREITAHRGYVTKWSGDSFAAGFPTVADAIQTALAIQRALPGAASANASSPLQFRASVHWGEGEQMPTQDREEVRGPVVLTCVQALGQVKPGKVVLTQQAREELRAELGEKESFQIASLMPDDYQPEIHGEPLPLFHVREALPLWMQVAFNAAKDLETLGIELPADLAERHDDYVRGTCRP